MSEEWRNYIFGTSLYLVSNYGRVKTIDRIVWRPNRRNGPDIPHLQYGRHLKLRPSKTGYLRVCLSANRKDREIKVHHLVAELFIGPRPSKKHGINHRDFNKTNNRPENLEWVTHAENMAHLKKSGRLKQIFKDRKEGRI